MFRYLKYLLKNLLWDLFVALLCLNFTRFSKLFRFSCFPCPTHIHCLSYLVFFQVFHFYFHFFIKLLQLFFPIFVAFSLSVFVIIHLIIFQVSSAFDALSLSKIAYALCASLCLSIGSQVPACLSSFAVPPSRWVLSWYVHFIKLPTTGATSTRCWPVSSSSCALWHPHLDNKRPLGKGVTQ